MKLGVSNVKRRVMRDRDIYLVLSTVVHRKRLILTITYALFPVFQSIPHCTLPHTPRSDKYYASAVDALRTGPVKAKSQRMAKTPTSEDDLVDNCNDVWLVEMHYRVAVSYQCTAWEKASKELTRLFATMKDTECQRRIDLREYMVAFMQRQERLFNALPAVHTTVLQGLVERDMNRTTLETTVQAAIRKRAEKLQRQDLKYKESKGNKDDDDNNNNTSSAADQLGDDITGKTLGSPLLSDLLRRSKVIERKNFGMMSSWRVSLAVITADGYCHMFELPGNTTRVSMGSAAEVALQYLIPGVQIPSADTIRQGKSNFVRGWCDSLVPAETLNLHNCKVVFGFDKTTLEVQETTASTGASKLLGKTTRRKVALRTVSKLEAQDLMAAMTSVQSEAD